MGCQAKGHWLETGQCLTRRTRYMFAVEETKEFDFAIFDGKESEWEMDEMLKSERRNMKWKRKKEKKAKGC